MGFGIIFGLLIGIPFDNSSFGILIGILIGGIFGYALEKRFNPNPIHLTKKQRRLKIILAIITFIVALVIAVFLATR